MFKKFIPTLLIGLLAGLALSLVLTRPAYADPPIPPFTVDIAATNVLTDVDRSSVAWGDYDNDGDLDILLTGCAAKSATICTNRIAAVYRNTGGAFTEDIIATAVLSGVQQSSVAWGDYDNDGDLDILLAGEVNGFKRIATVYRNTGGTFAEDLAAKDALTGVWYTSVAWGDYDDDGDLDVLLTGDDGSSNRTTAVYRNTGGTFAEDIAATGVLTNVRMGSVAWGDYDNDGDLDILLTGGDAANNPLTAVYKNTNGVFTEDVAATGVLTGVRNSSVAWGDYDDDGDLDILLTGEYTATDPIAAVYENTNGVFTEDVAATNVLENVSYSSVAWGDYDNDGDLDVLLTGVDDAHSSITAVYENTDGAFAEDVAATGVLTDVSYGGAAWGDYDNDGDLDILLTGVDPFFKSLAAVYRNEVVTANALPGAPTGLSANVKGQTVELSWAAPTPVTYTTPITSLSYNLRVGSSPGLSDTLAPMALDDGYRQVVRLGNAQHGLSATLTLPPGTYYWSVQAVDHTFAGSPFAAEDSFVIAPFTVDITATNILTGVQEGSVAWGDYDNDGDLDVLLTGDDGSNPIAAVYENVDGTFSEDVAATGVLTGVYRSGVAWGDYDNDGDLDILLTGDDGSNSIAAVYQNTGGAFVEDMAATDVLTGVRFSSVAWGDYDNDGDPDVLLTGLDDGNNRVAAVYKNTDGAFSVDITATNVLTGVAANSVAWGDYDNDSDLDVLSTGCAAGICSTPVAAVYRNTGGAFSPDTAATGVLTDVSASSVAWGDYDDDGDLDVLLTGCTAMSGMNCIGRAAAVYQNTGGAFSPDAGATDVLTDVDRSSVAWGDYDNDGDLDILLTGDDGSNPIAAVYENTGGAFSVNITATNALTGVSNSSVAWGDYDNDGALDILLTGQDASSNPVAAVYRNNSLTANTPPGAPTGFDADVNGQTVVLRWAAPTPVTYTTPITSLSYNLRVGSNPGLLDALAPMALNDGYRQVVQLGNAQHGLSATLVLTCGTYYWSVQAVDHTFAGSHFADERYFTICPPPPPFTKDITATDALTGVIQGSVAWGDYDNDGDLDILLTGHEAGADTISAVYRNTDGAFTVDATATDVLTDVEASSVAWGDYDNDGDLDILLTGRDTENNPVAAVYRNTGGAFVEDVAATGVLPGVSTGSAAWGDYDNDGDLDVLLTGDDGSNPTASVYRNTGGTFTEDVAATGVLTGVKSSSVAWGDYDGDGDLDILLTGWNGSSRITAVYRNTGGAFTVDVTATDVLPAVSIGSVAWGDYDDDGDLDILLTGMDTGNFSSAAVYRNTGGTFAVDIAATDVLTGVSYSSAAWGDYDNDGDLDILLTGWFNVYHNVATVYRNTGGTFVEDLAATNVLSDVAESSVAWGDYDNDGDLDILLTGRSSGSKRIATVYRNDVLTANVPPGAPTGLIADVVGQTANLSWAAPTPPPAYTTPDTSLTYNLRVGTSPTLSDILAPMALSDGYRQVVQLGNAQHGLTATLALPYGAYYWSVQAVDHAFAGSPFAAEGSFLIGTPAIAVSKLANVNSATVGETIIYTYRVTNTGDITLDPVTAYDDRLGAVTLGATALAPNAGTSGTLSYQVPAGHPTGPLANTVTVTGTPPIGSKVSATDSAVVTISDVVNQAPQFTSAPVEAATVGVAYTYAITATDANAGDTLTIAAPTRPGWLTLAETGNGTATLSGTPGSADVGAHPVTLMVSDSGGLTDTQSFTVTVTGANTPPTISDIPDQRTYANTILSPIPFTVGDVETDPGDLLLAAESSDTALVPVSGIVLGGSGTDRTVTVTPAANLTGATTITITVNDGTDTDFDTFELTVEPFRIYLPFVRKD